MPIASAVQLPLPFETLPTERPVGTVSPSGPTAEWRTFGSTGPARQWIAFPPFDRDIANLTRHVRRSLLVQFIDAGIWMFRIAPRYDWPHSDLAGVAAVCRRFLGSPCLNLKTLHRQLAERIDATFEVLLPALDADQLTVWQTRTLAVDEVMAQATLGMRRNSGQAAEPNLTLLAEGLEARMAVELSDALRSFLAHLDIDAIRAASGNGSFSTQAFNMLTGLSTEVQRNRRQFTRTFPLFAEALLLGNASQAYVVGLLDAVDSGKSMTDFLAQTFHVQRHTIRFLVGKSPEEVGRRWSGSPAHLIALLDSLPPELRPAEPEAWAVINCLVAAAEDRTLRQVSRALVRIAMQHWRRRLHGGDVGSGGTRTDFTAQAELVTEFWAMVEDCLRTRAATTHRGTQGISRRTIRALADGMIAERGWPGLVALARDWRHALVRAQAAVQPDRERLMGERFASLLPRDLLIGDRLVVPLTTSRELRREGQVLEHCIGSYASACATGESYIVSLRDPRSGHPLSTAEFQITRDRPGLVQLALRQHRGRGNADPAPECANAVRRLLVSAESPDLQTHWARLLAEREAQHGYAPSAARRIAAILAHEHALREILGPRGRYERLLDQLRTEA